MLLRIKEAENTQIMAELKQWIAELEIQVRLKYSNYCWIQTTNSWIRNSGKIEILKLLLNSKFKIHVLFITTYPFLPNKYGAHRGRDRMVVWYTVVRNIAW
jgi:hypothetical protein